MIEFCIGSAVLIGIHFILLLLGRKNIKTDWSTFMCKHSLASEVGQLNRVDRLDVFCYNTTLKIEEAAVILIVL